MELLVGNAHGNSTMSLNSSSSSSNSSQTQLVTATDQPHPPVRSSIKDSPILRSLSRRSQKLQSRQESISDNFEPTSIVSIEDTCVVDRISHCITLHKPLTKMSNQPKEDKEEPMDYHIQQQSKEMLGRSDSERSLMDEGAPVCSCDHQPLHPDGKSECPRQPDKLQEMETSQDYDKSANAVTAAAAATATATATATVKKRILEETNKSMCVCVFGCVCVCVCVCVCACACACACVHVCVSSV